MGCVSRSPLRSGGVVCLLQWPPARPPAWRSFVWRPQAFWSPHKGWHAWSGQSVHPLRLALTLAPFWHPDEVVDVPHTARSRTAFASQASARLIKPHTRRGAVVLSLARAAVRRLIAPLDSWCMERREESRRSSGRAHGPLLALLAAALTCSLGLSQGVAAGHPPPPPAKWQVLHKQTPTQQGTHSQPAIRYGHTCAAHHGQLVTSHGYFYNREDNSVNWLSDTWLMPMKPPYAFKRLTPGITQVSQSFTGRAWLRAAGRAWLTAAGRAPRALRHEARWGRRRHRTRRRRPWRRTRPARSHRRPAAGRRALAVLLATPHKHRRRSRERCTRCRARPQQPLKRFKRVAVGARVQVWPRRRHAQPHALHVRRARRRLLAARAAELRAGARL